MPSRITDKFLTEIVQEWTDAARVEVSDRHGRLARRPAVVVAQQRATSVKNVHGWVAEARRRGLMAAAPERGRVDDGTSKCPTCGGNGRVSNDNGEGRA